MTKSLFLINGVDLCDDQGQESRLNHWRSVEACHCPEHPAISHHDHNIQYVDRLLPQYVVVGWRGNCYDAAMATILIWAHDATLAGSLLDYLAEPGRSVRVLESDAELAASGAAGGLLVAQAGPRLAAQQAFLRGPFILVDPARSSHANLARRAYAVVANPPEAGLAVDAYFTHCRLAEAAAAHRAPPRRCLRCGRGFDPLRAKQGGSARRFVRFGTNALCGGCVEQLRTLLRQVESAVVDADA